MLIKSLQIRNFRNLHKIDASFAPGLNVIHGANAQGKTNLLEAIYLLVTGRTFRTSDDSEIVPWDIEEYDGTLIRAQVEKSAGEEQLGFYFDGRNKRVLVDGKPLTRLAHLVGRLNAVLFTPTDLMLVRGAPALRRRFMDIAIGQTSRRYIESLQDYQQVLKNRNAILKQALHRSHSDIGAQLDVYDEQLAEAGAILMEARNSAVAEISAKAAEHYSRICLQREQMLLKYEQDIDNPDNKNNVGTHAREDLCASELKNQLLSTLRRTRVDDLRRLSTSRGPHRDDFSFQIDNYSARQFASQGQQRSAVLALKFAELDYIRTHTHEQPLLMLDDVISELDEQRRTALLQHLGTDIQTFITTTDSDSVTRQTSAQTLLRVESGSLLKDGSATPPNTEL